jgi:hypothetical protein
MGNDTMMCDTIEFLRLRLRDALALTDEEVIAEAPHVFSTTTRHGLLVSLLGLSPESTWRAARPHRDDATRLPPLAFSGLVLFAFRFASYQSTLIRLEQTLQYFHDHPLFTGGGDAPTSLPASLQQLDLAQIETDLAGMSALWPALGLPYLPSVIYRVHVHPA